MDELEWRREYRGNRLGYQNAMLGTERTDWETEVRNQKQRRMSIVSIK